MTGIFKRVVHEPKKTITVCDKCLQASCWQGLFMCDESQHAGIVEKTREELTVLGREHPWYWGAVGPKPHITSCLTKNDVLPWFCSSNHEALGFIQGLGASPVKAYLDWKRELAFAIGNP